MAKPSSPAPHPFWRDKHGLDLATLGDDPRTIVVGLARGGMVDVPSDAGLAVAEALRVPPDALIG